MALDATLVANLFGLTSAGPLAGDPAQAVAKLRRAADPGATEKGIAREEKDPVTIQALDRFETAVAKAKDLKTALKDPRILNVLLTGLGLADQTGNPGLAQKALMSDPDAKDGLLAKLDSRWRTAAGTLQLATKGLEALKDPDIQASIRKGFLSYQYRTGLDEGQPGISDALYFTEQAKDVEKVYDILGNAVMRRVVTGALGLPDAMAVQSVETQARAVQARLKLADLDDPKKVQKLAERYVMAQAQAAQASATGTGDALSQITSLAVSLRV
jgi:hypothetical protein